MTARQIPKGFRHGKRIAQTSMACEGYFWRLVDAVDSHGNINADLEYLCKETSGARELTSDQIAIWVSELLAAELAVLYTIGRRRYLHLERFERWAVSRAETPVRVVPGIEKAHTIMRDAVTNLFNEPRLELEVSNRARKTITRSRATKRKKTAEVELPPPFTSEEFISALQDWEQGRREKGKRVTPTVRRLSYEKLTEMGEQRAIAALRLSARQGYTGIWEHEESSSSTTKQAGRETAAERTARLLRERQYDED